MIFTLICFAGLPAAAQAPAGSDEARVLRTPALHGGQIVFSWAGDLYTVDAAGGTARKLTSHEGYEIFPRFSPDGNTMAFTGEYDGNREVFLIPREGGVPMRLTTTSVLSRDDVSDRMGPNNIVLGWKNDSSKMLVFQNGRYAIIPLPTATIQISDALDLSGMKAMADLRAEWD